MTKKPSQSLKSVDQSRTTRYRKVLTFVASAGVLSLGFLFFQSMQNRYWTMAILSALGVLSLIPWVTLELTTRDCLATSLSLGTGAASGIGAIFLYFGLFHFEWFGDIFNDKGSGPFGLILFFTGGFWVGAFMTIRLLFYLSLPTSPDLSTLMGNNRDSDSKNKNA